jgi:hypothetical protein
MNKAWLVVFLFLQMYSLMITGCSEDITIPPASTRFVILYTPPNDTTLPNTTNIFKWGTTAENADSFKFQITQDSLFISGVESYGVKNTEFQINPTGDTNYFYWRVTGFWRNHGDSGLSSTRRYKER